MKIHKVLIIMLAVLCFVSASFAEDVGKSDQDSQMPVSDGSESAKDSVDNNNAVQEAEEEQSEEKDGEEDGKSEGDKGENEEESEETVALKIQGASDYSQIQSWIEDLLGRNLDLNDSDDEAVYNFWCSLFDQGYSLNQVQSLIDTVGVLKKAINDWYGGSFFQMGKVNLDDVQDVISLFHWANLINKGFTQTNVKMLVILVDVFMQELNSDMIHRGVDVTKERDVNIIASWASYRRQGYSGKQIYNMFKNRLSPKVNQLLGKFDAGFFTYFAEHALAGLNGGLDYTCNLLQAMADVRASVEALIGNVDFMDQQYNDNGFLTYWAEQAVEKGAGYINQHLSIWKRLLPYIETQEGRALNLYDSEDGGILSNWAVEVETRVDGGMSLENAIDEVIQLIQGGGGGGLTPTQEALVPYVEALLGVTFDQGDAYLMGFLTYWAERADAEGLAGIQNLLDAMAGILPQVEALIGPVNLLDENDKGNGFLTHWAEQVIAQGSANVIALLQAMAEIADEVEALLGGLNFFDNNPQDDGFITFWAQEIVAGNITVNEVETLFSDITYLKPAIDRALNRTLDPTDENDSGILFFWAGEVTRLMGDEGLTHQEALLRVEQAIIDAFNLSEVTFYMTGDEVVFFDGDGNIIYTFTLPEDEGIGEFNPKFILISPDDSFAIVVWEAISHTSWITSHHQDHYSFNATKIDLVGKTEQKLPDFSEKAGYIKDVVMTENGKYLMLSYQPWQRLPGQVIFFNLETNQEIANTALRGGPEVSVDMMLSPDNTRLYVLSDHAFVMIFDVYTGEVLATIETPWYYTYNWEGTTYISDDGNILTVVGEDGIEVQYNVTDLNNIFKIENVSPEIIEALIPYIEALIGAPYDENNPQHEGFMMFWAEQAVAGNLQDVQDLLGAMAGILPQVEALIGVVDLLDNNTDDNGFLSYWAEQAVSRGVEEVNRVLYIWERLVPYIEDREGRALDLFDSDDSGIVSFWADEVTARVDGGMSLEDAIDEVIELILNPGGVLTPTQEALVPYVEALLGVAFDQDDAQLMGFLSYWAERADAEGLVNIQNLLDAMADILIEVEALIGPVNLLDENDKGNGFLTYWAEQVIATNLTEVKTLLSNIAAIRPSLEALVGSIDLLDDSHEDNGLITFWAQYAQDYGLQHTIDIINNMAQVKDEVEALIGTVDLYDNQYGDNGFLTYWAEYAIDVGINTVEVLLANMAAILPEVEAVIGAVDLFDNNYDDNGFLTYWAEYAVANGVQKTKDILSNMNTITNND
ncbi:MAG: hypothetical protein P9M06_04570, partial [Candidatus Saelkia tenebricola]|nr:hypothetical protein [Candidatus Saelkia tenebricola]